VSPPFPLHFPDIRALDPSRELGADLDHVAAGPAVRHRPITTRSYGDRGPVRAEQVVRMLRTAARRRPGHPGDRQQRQLGRYTSSAASSGVAPTTSIRSTTSSGVTSKCSASRP